MAINRFTASAVLAAQVVTLTIGGTPGVSNTIYVTIGSKTVTYTLTGGDTNVTALAALLLLLQAYTAGEFLEVTFASPTTTTITATDNTPGMNFIMTSGGTTSTLTAVVTVANSGPNDWSCAANWSLGTVPSGDDTTLELCNISLLYGLDQSAATSANSYTRYQSYTGALGLPDFNVAGNYFEYRPKKAKFSVVTGHAVNLGDGPGSGPTLERYDFNGSQPIVTVNGTGSSNDQAVPALEICNCVTAALLYANKGDVGLAITAGDSNLFAKVYSGQEQSQGSDVTIRSSTTSTIAELDMNGGRVEHHGPITTFKSIGGEAAFIGTNALATATVQPGAVLYWQSTGTLGQLNLYPRGKVNFDRDMRPKTITAASIYGGSYVDSFAVTKGTPLSFIGCGPDDMDAFVVGKGLILTGS